MGLRILKITLVALLALVLGYIAAVVIGVAAFEIFDVPQRDGGAGMVLMFVIGPPVAILCAVIAGVWYGIASGRRAAAAGVAAVPAGGASQGTGSRLLPVIGAAMVGWLAGTVLQWVMQSRPYGTIIVALAVSMVPWLGAIVLAGGTWWLTRPRTAAGPR